MSETAITTEAGLLAGAQWITHPAWATAGPPWSRPTLRTVIDAAAAVVHAELAVLAVGVWVAHLGGRPVSPNVLEPGSSDFARQVALCRYDVTELIGDRTEFVLQLGEGSAHVRRAPDRYTKFVGSRIAPRARVAITLEFADGSSRRIVSGPDWQAGLGPTVLAHWYGGEDYDAREEPAGWLTPEGTADDAWGSAVVVGDVDADPRPWSRRTPPVRVQEVLQPQLREAVPDGEVVDFGRNLAGRPVITIAPGFPSGTRIDLLPAEYLGPDRTVDQHSTGSPIVDTYTTAASSEPVSWHPQFGYHGFRYLQLRATGPDGESLPTDGIQVTAQRLMTDDVEAGAFRCDDAMLNDIHSLVHKAIQSNLLSVPTDCPHREKLGWLEQLHLVFEPLARSHNVADHLADMITHVVDAQTADGMIPSIAPELVVFDIATRFGPDHGFRDDVNWGSVIWQLPWQLYRCYGDVSVVRAAWRPGLAYLRYLEGICAAGDIGELLDHGLADWITLDESTPRVLVASYGLIAMIDTGVRLAAILGEEREGERLSTRAEQLRRALAADQAPADTDFATRSQAALALLLDLGGVLTPAQQSAAEIALVQRIHADGDRLTVGEIGLPALLRVLAGLGEHDLIRTMISRTDVPGYGQMVTAGCTALAEHWTEAGSRSSANHFMLGYVDWWLTGWVAGLRQAQGDVGWRQAEIGIVPLAGIDRVEHTYAGVSGQWSVEWRRRRSEIELLVTVPEGCSPRIVTPAGFRSSTGAQASTVGPGRHREVFAEMSTD